MTGLDCRPAFVRRSSALDDLMHPGAFQPRLVGLFGVHEPVADADRWLAMTVAPLE